MLERDRILKKIYKNCFMDPDIKLALSSDWFYVYQLLEAGEEDEIPDAILEMIELWLDSDF